MKFYSIWLALACIVVFMLQALVPGFTELFVLNQLSFQQPWRFLTSIFLHGSLPHLIYNLFALVFFGLITEKLIGSRKFLLVFFSAGIFANIAAVNFYSSSLGASGAIYGVLGTLTIIRPLMTVFVYSLPMPMFVAAILWIIGDFLGLFMPSNVGNLAHLAGIFLGLVFGFLFRQRRERSERKIQVPETYIRNWEEKFMK